MTKEKSKNQYKNLSQEKDKYYLNLCIILPQMRGYIKYFKNGGKKMSFMAKDDDVLDKYNKIWDKI